MLSTSSAKASTPSSKNRYSPKATPDKPEVIPGEFLVGVDKSESLSLAKDLNLEVLDTFQFAGLGPDKEIWHVKSDSRSPALLEALAQQPGVRYAEPNIKLDRAVEETPNDLAPQLWGLHNTGQQLPRRQPGKAGADINAPEAWKTVDRKPGQKTLVAVVDTGIDVNHPDLKNQLWTNPNEIAANGIDDDGNGVVDDIHGIDARLMSGDVQDVGTHGTHVSGTIAAQGNNGEGVIGVDHHAQIMTAAAIGGPNASMSATIRAIEYASEMGAQVFNHSWGVPAMDSERADGGHRSLAEAISGSDALHVCAVGNDGVNLERSPRFPACLPLDNVLGVGATNNQDEIAIFSNYGNTHVDMLAPGQDIWSTVPGDYGFKNGTSMAAPHVTGTASLLLSQEPELSPNELKKRLIASGDKLAALKEGATSASGRRLNAERALSRDRIAPSPPQSLSAKDTGAGVKIRWNAGSDSGQTLAGTEVRWSSSPLSSEEFSAAKRLNSGTTGAPGQAGSTTLNVMPSEKPRRVYLGARSYDESGNTSSIRSTSTVVAPRHILHNDMFGDWMMEAPWDVTMRHNEVVWVDAPSGYYDKDMNASIQSPPIDLGGTSEPTLHIRIEHEYDPQSQDDGLFLEVRQAGQDKWKTLKSFYGVESEKVEGFDLSEYAGSQVEFRFRAVSDFWEERAGTTLREFVISDKKA